ncbi:hypothetical protein BS78_09G120200 [Paspalum vaginatum]|nr:hypothetical protein BS78_09G120200 [Paspalum vaginatum]
MDATKEPVGKEALPPAADAQQAAETSSPEPDAAACGEEDDEQVERFYALLDNIRAMRGMLGGAAAPGRKRRAREAEPPWRPAFRMEDFEVEEADSYSAWYEKQKEKEKVDGRESSGCGASRATADDEEAEDGEVVVEAKGPPRKAARRVAREC